ncbi:fimbrial protein [Erwinia sp. E_sp_B04_7]|uniref:fimbrial protein n=1 Tax=unclassified Erwinia TaxID=2622719 RepID=UPI0030D3FA38
MNKLILTSLLPVLMASVSPTFAADPVPPKIVTVDGGDINFTGSIVSAPCSVENGSDGQSVYLGQVASNQFTSQGDTSSPVKFKIKLTGCNLTPLTGDTSATVGYTKATVKFMGDAINATTLKLSGENSGDAIAKNVGIQISQGNKPVTINDYVGTTSHELTEGANEIPFTAAYVATDAAVTAGVANSTVNFRVTYE